MPLGSHPVIKMDSVSKIFYTDELETHALSAIDLEIASGEYVSIGGPSGCGKSTLLAILGLLDSPTKGNYQLSVTRCRPENRRSHPHPQSRNWIYLSSFQFDRRFYSL